MTATAMRTPEQVDADKARLAELGPRCHVLAAEYKAALAERDALIRQLVDVDGVVRREVADLAKLVPVRVSQIAETPSRKEKTE